MKRLALIALLFPSVALASDTWPAFRGNGNSVADASRLPVTWSEKDVAWKVDLPGYGQSAPIVWKDRVFVTSVAGDQREKGFVGAYDATSGKKLWQFDFEPTQKAKWSFSISKAAPTPAVDAAAVYTFFEGGDVLALDHGGKLLWKRSLVDDYGAFKNNHGLAASPVLTDDAVIVLVDDRGPSYLVALDKATGKNIWKKDRPQKGSWTSPVVHSGRKEIIISSNGTVGGYDLKTGEPIWELDGLSGNTIPSATIAGDRVIIGAGASKGDLKAAIRSNCCVQLSTKSNKTAAEFVWRADKATASYASPLVHKGGVYFVNQSGVVTCLDVETGKERFTDRIDGACWASPIAAGEHLYFFGKDGVTTVLKAGPTFEKVASNRLWSGEKNAKDDASPYGGSGPVLYGVAAVDGAFFARTGPTLYRVGVK